jgi:hypothetical protein
VELLDMVVPDSLLKGIPLGLDGRRMDGSRPVAAKCADSGHPMKAIARVKVRTNQVAQQVHVYSSSVTNKLKDDH